MITRLYVHQYKCLVDFDLQLKSLQLLSGRNGSGKTTVFDVLSSLQRVISGRMVPGVEFPAATTLTAWATTPEQRFELDIAGNGGRYTYRLELKHDLPRFECHVSSEQLTFDGQELLTFDGHTVRLFADNGQSQESYPFRGTLCPLSTVKDHSCLSRTMWFRNWIANDLHIYSPDAPRIGASRREDWRPDRSLGNLTHWLSYEAVNRPDNFHALHKYLVDDVIVGLEGIEWNESAPGARQLLFKFRDHSGSSEKTNQYWLPIGQLSDGQRMLIALYAIAFLNITTNSMVCIEEPDNFLGLNEIQPWLSFLRDQVEDQGAQCLLISHHPEILNYLAAYNGIWLERTDTDSVRTEPFANEIEEVLTPAELVLRGWR